MAFDIVEGPVRTFWAASDGSSTYYKGQIVTFSGASAGDTNGTCLPLAVPVGAADTTNKQLIAGIVVGFNRRNPRYATVGGGTFEYDTGVVTQADQVAREYTGAEGMYRKNDPQVLIQVAAINMLSVIRGPIFNNAYGTAPTLLTNTASDTTGGTSAFATNACSFTPVASLCTTYCRTGNNAGLYRVSSDTSTTAPANVRAFPYDIGVGDTFVRVPLKQGISYIYISGPGLYINCSATPATNYFTVFCTKLNLSVSGWEYAEFRFGRTHFDFERQ
jgi:hypothetical protein